MRIDAPSRYQEPGFLPWDGRRVPITFIGGYLGAGKTTLINELLAAVDRPIAVVVNDVGSVNIDARLIRRTSAGMIELTDGCICCSSLDGMGAALDAIRARSTPPDHVVVELSGVADPQRMVPWGRSAGFRLDGVVVVVAADQLSAGGLAPAVSAMIRTHIASADLVVLTKRDLVDDVALEQVTKELAHVAPRVPVVDAQQGTRLPGAIGRFLALGGRRPGGVAATPGPTMFDLHEITTLSVPTGLTADGLRTWIDQNLMQQVDGQPLVRAKGVVDTSDTGPMLVQIVGPRVELSPLPHPEDEPTTDLVVIRLRF